MGKKECVTMILAGGKGARLGSLTNDIAKPAVYYGGKYRIIDFTLSNCMHSGMDTLGLLTQYKASELHNYVNNGQTWNLDRIDGGTFHLPSTNSGGLYTGTANAVYQNIAFAEQFNPEHILILSGDHVYKMDYKKMLNFHKETNADATISVVSVPLAETSRYGILSTDENGLITEFEEKPKIPKSNLASMGIYIFKWSRLKKYLTADKDNIRSQNDFGKNIIPAMLSSGEKLYAYRFEGYWKDVGTVQSLWESNMDLLADSPEVDLYDEWEIFTGVRVRPPCHIASKARVRRSIIVDGCVICGNVENSVVSDSVYIGEGAEIIDSIIMPGAVIGRNAKIYRSIIGEQVTIGQNSEIGADDGLDTFFDDQICSKDISVIGPKSCISNNTKIKKNSHVDNDILLLQKRQPAVVEREIEERQVVGQKV